MLITDILLTAWQSTRKVKLTPSGWYSGNCALCHDRRGRGGVHPQPNGGVSYCCFNCNTRISWHPGMIITHRMIKLLRALNINDDIIDKLKFQAIRSKDYQQTPLDVALPIFQEKPLPKNAQPLMDIIKNNEYDVMRILMYLKSRGLYLDDWTWYHSPEMPNRIIIPFYHQEKILGWTARSIDNLKPRYIMSSVPGYVFNLDQQIKKNRQYLIICEGPLDAICLDGCAILSNAANKQQCQQINNFPQRKILVPDRDAAGEKLIQTALDNAWMVSFPPWESGVKDINDAVKHQGRLTILWQILNNIETTAFKIKLKARTWFKG